MPIIAVILMLGTPKARSNGPAFAFGWVVGLVVVSVIVLLVAGDADQPVVGPVIFYMVASKTAAKPLGDIKEFMLDHNATIMMVVLLILGAELIGAGIAGLDN